MVLVAKKAGVICRSCGEGIEIEDEYIPGIRGAEVAAGFYGPVRGRPVDFVNRTWQRTVTCGNPACGRTHEYGGDDLVIFDG